MTVNAEDGENRDNTIAAKARARALSILSYGQHQADRVVSPTTRQRVLDSTTSFASRRPLLSLFIAVQLLTSLFPLLLFTTFVISALLVGLLSGVAFVIFWTGVALLFLVPTLFLTCGLAILFWLWAVCTYIVARAIYSRLPMGVRATEKHVIFHTGSPPAKPTHGFDFDAAVDAEVAAARE